MDTLLRFLFEQLISFAATSLDNCSANTHYQSDLRRLKEYNNNKKASVNEQL
jgi:hypothetical protein